MPVWKNIIISFAVTFAIILVYRSLIRNYLSKSEIQVKVRNSTTSSVSPVKTAWRTLNKTEMQEYVYNPARLWIRKEDILYQTEYMALPNCSHVMADWYQRNQMHDPEGEIPSKLPLGVMEIFTKRLIKLVEGPEDANKKFDRTPITWTRDQIDELISKEPRDFNEYSEDAQALSHALKKIDVNGKTGLIFGSSREPWIEALALQEGARKLIKTGPVNITVDDYRYISYVNPVEMSRKYHEYINTFDFAALFSIETLGFGRLDAFNPNGDILELQKTYCMLKHEGILFLGVPIGMDAVVWNSSRVYGRIRLGLLTAAWDILAMYDSDGEKEISLEDFENASKAGDHKRVVLILKKRHSTAGLF